MRVSYLSLIILIVFWRCSLDEEVINIEPLASYKLTFTAFWSEETHPQDFPRNPHFSGLIGMVHNENTELFYEGELASDGIKEMAEKGKKEPLEMEIENLILNDTAIHLISGNFLNQSPGEIIHEFQASEKHSLVSIVTMIAPSPDWFVSVCNVNLIENGKWLEEKTLSLSAYDAGTDSGTTYTSENQETIPHEQISKITSPPLGINGEVPLLGIVRFERIP